MKKQQKNIEKQENNLIDKLLLEKNNKNDFGLNTTELYNKNKL